MRYLTSSRARAGAIIILIMFLALVWAPWMIQDRIANDGPGHQWWVFWVQTLSGNWTPYVDPPVSRRLYGLSAIIALLTNNALGLVIAGLVWRLVVDWRRRMRLDQILAAKEAATMVALYKRFPNDMPQIRDAVRESRELWSSELVNLFGEAEARRLLSMMSDKI